MKFITYYRINRGWSQAELARQAKINPSTLGLIEKGRFIPYQSQLERLAHALEIPIEAAEHLMAEAVSHVQSV